MAHAIELGKKAFGVSGDNPNVGCVIVAGDKIIGEGHTSPPGGPHAEVSACVDAGQRGYSLTGATLFSTVEPCSFHGRTPACTKTIISKKIKRVVIGIRDPHPKVSGEGVRLLQEAGIEVTEQVCEKEVETYLNHWLEGYR